MTETREKVVLVNNYQTVQALSFASIDTVAGQWNMSKVIGVGVFAIPEGYNQVYPYSTLNKLAYGESICELCGHDIINQFPIHCDAKRVFMFVGSECVNNFSGAGYTHKKIVEYKETTLSRIFRAWCKLARQQTYNDPIFHELINGHSHTWGDTVVVKHDVWKFDEKLAHLIDFNILPERKAEELRSSPFSRLRDINELSARKIANIFKKAKKLGYYVPDAVEPLIIGKRVNKSEADIKEK